MDDELCRKFIKNPNNSYIELCRKYGYSLPKPLISSTFPKPIITTLDLSYLIFPIEILSIIISFTKLNKGNKIIQILCLINIWFSKNIKLIIFLNIIPNNYPKLRDNGVKSLTNLTSLDLFNNNIITDNGFDQSYFPRFII